MKNDVDDFGTLLSSRISAAIIKLLTAAGIQRFDECKKNGLLESFFYAPYDDLLCLGTGRFFLWRRKIVSLIAHAVLPLTGESKKRLGLLLLGGGEEEEACNYVNIGLRAFSE